MNSNLLVASSISPQAYQFVYYNFGQIPFFFGCIDCQLRIFHEIHRMK